MNRSLITPFILLAIASSAHAQSTEQRSNLSDQQGVAVTIYNENLALVKDQRRLQIKPGTSSLAFRDVSARMRPETALLRSTTAPGSLTVLEQNFDFDLLTPQKLLEKYVGRNVQIIRTNPATGAETTEQAQVLSANNGVVLQIGSRIETGIPGRIVCNLPTASNHTRQAASHTRHCPTTCVTAPPWSWRWTTPVLRNKMWN